MRVKPGAKKASVEKQADGSLVVRVKERAQEGEANRAVIEAIARYFDIPKLAVQIVRGHASRNKLIEMKGVSR